MFFKIGVLKNFANFTAKHVCLSLFLIKLQAWGPVTLLKRDSNTKFSCKICEILKTPFFREHLQRLLLRLVPKYFVCREKCHWRLVSRLWTKYLLFPNKLLFTDVPKDSWFKHFLEISRNSKNTFSQNVLTWSLWIFLLNRKSEWVSDAIDLLSIGPCF